jgi:excisionase family DNA binding protein
MQMQKNTKGEGHGLVRSSKGHKVNGRIHRGNVVRWAVDTVGGPLRAAVVMRVSLRTTYEWIRKGEIRLLKPALRLARLSGARVEELAGSGDDTEEAL